MAMIINWILYGALAIVLGPAVLGYLINVIPQLQQTIAAATGAATGS